MIYGLGKFLYSLLTLGEPKKKGKGNGNRAWRKRKPGLCPECGEPYWKAAQQTGHGITAMLYYHDVFAGPHDEIVEGAFCVSPVDDKPQEDNWDGGQYYDNFVDGRGF